MDRLINRPVAVRRAVPNDIPAMHRIRMSVQENQLSDPSLLTERDYLRFIASKGETWVALIGDEVVGFAAIDLTEQSVWALFVKPGQEGVGLGQCLMAELVKSATDRGFSTLELVTTPGTRAEAFYLRSGWQPVRVEANGECRLALTLN